MSKRFFLFKENLLIKFFVKKTVINTRNIEKKNNIMKFVFEDPANIQNGKIENVKVK
jgi:hypothetical protein